jgi:hypothetical protein
LTGKEVISDAWSNPGCADGGEAETNVTKKLLTVSSCKNLKKYFAIKSIISLFRAAMQQATTSFSSSFLISRNFVAGIISVIIISITGITG